MLNSSQGATSPFVLDDILITHELERRVPRDRQPHEELEALHALAAELAAGAASMLSELVSAAVRLCGAGTAGLSLLQRDSEGNEIFRWVAMAGRLADSLGGSTPRHFSPCGTCLDRGSAQLYDRPGRYFPYLEPAGIVEGLVVPLFAAQGVPAAGTLWIVSHDARVRFDREDVRLMTSLASFVSASLQLNRAGTEVERRLRDAAQARRRSDEFIAVLGHELRNPLEPIRSGLDLIRRLAAPEQTTPLDRVDRHVRDLSRLVDELLDVTRLTRGSFELQCRKVMLHTVVERGVEMAAPLAQRRLHTISTDCEPGIVIDCDPLRLQQLVANLVVNAARFTPPGGRIYVSSTATHDRANIEVRDTGVGLTLDALERIFEPFVQLPPDDRCESGGLGIGLTMVKRLAAVHGGRVSARSDGPDRGSAFIVDLPCTRVGLVPD